MSTAPPPDALTSPTRAPFGARQNENAFALAINAQEPIDTAATSATSREQLQQLAVDYQRTAGGRVVIVGPAGQTIADSDRILASAPRDLDTATMSWVIDDPSRPGLSSLHHAGPGILFADGIVRRLGTSFPSGTLRALTTIAGGE